LMRLHMNSTLVGSENARKMPQLFTGGFDRNGRIMVGARSEDFRAFRPIPTGVVGSVQPNRHKACEHSDHYPTCIAYLPLKGRGLCGSREEFFFLNFFSDHGIKSYETYY
jgi:hypothetical protein